MHRLRHAVELWLEEEGPHLAVAGVALGHHGGGLEGRVGDLGHGQLLVVGLLRGDDRGVGGEHEVDARVGHQVGLELCYVHVQCAIEAQRGGQRRDDLSDQPVQSSKHTSSILHCCYFGARVCHAQKISETMQIVEYSAFVGACLAFISLKKQNI